MTRQLPQRPSITHLHKEAKKLLHECRANDRAAIEHVLSHSNQSPGGSSNAFGVIKLSDAQRATARDYGFHGWESLIAHAQALTHPGTTGLSPFDDPRFEEISYRQELARSIGLPQLGTTKVSGHGVKYTVTDYQPVATPARAARISGGGLTWTLDDLLPIVILQEMSPRLNSFCIETDLVTAKNMMFLDTVPELRPNMAAPGVHQVSCMRDSDSLQFLFDAKDLHETIVAHELGHTWIEAAKLGIIGREHYSWSIDTSGNCELVMTTRDGSSIDPVRFIFKVSSEVVRKWHHQELGADHRPGWGGKLAPKSGLTAGNLQKDLPIQPSNPTQFSPSIATNGRHSPPSMGAFNPNTPPRHGIQTHRPPFGANSLPNPVSGGPHTRNYSAGLGLWLSQVGFEQQELGEKPYGYALNNPVTFVDPEGLFPCSPLAPAVPAPIPAPPSATGEASCYADNFKNCCTACGTCFNPCSNYAAILPGANGIWGCGDQVKCCKTSNPAVCITVIIADTGKEDRLIDLPCCYAKKKGFMPSPGLVSVTCTRIGHVGVGGATSCPPKGDCAPPSNRGVNCGGLLDRNGNIIKKKKKTK